MLKSIGALPRSIVPMLAQLLVFVSVHVQVRADPGPPNPTLVRPSLDPARTANGLALVPPMGWNSWNRFGCDVDAAKVRASADAMVASGMRDAGYAYVIIDDCWQGPRNRDGTITADPVRFPGGIAGLAAYIHARGLKFGLYSDAGSKTCGGRPGSQGHEYQDAAIYARWGVDYLKYDWCWTGSRDAEEAYALIADALRASGRPILLSICEWGTTKPWTWGAKIGNLWRTSADIRDAWAGRVGFTIGMTDIVDVNEPLARYAGPGHWNDPDMLEVGNGGMTDVEYRSHFSLWAMMAAPLIAGNDVAGMTGATRAILTNRDVIAIDQDPAGVQGRRLWARDGRELWVRPLADGGRAVLLFNRTAGAATMGFRWTEIGVPPPRIVRDLWTHANLRGGGKAFSTKVEPHGVVMLRLGGRRDQRTV